MSSAPLSLGGYILDAGDGSGRIGVCGNGEGFGYNALDGHTGDGKVVKL